METKLTTAAVENAIENFCGTVEQSGLPNKQKTFSTVVDARYKKSIEQNLTLTFPN